MSEPVAHLAIRLNGEPYTLTGPQCVAALLERLKLGGQRIAVELNRAVVPRAEYEKTILKDGDEVEIITFVGGG